MKRLLLAGTVAAAALSFAAPSQAYFFNGCNGDWTIADVVVGNTQVVKACTSRPPVVTHISCQICPPLPIN
jgi:hypothetical protein